jgi:hypothetical protein
MSEISRHPNVTEQAQEHIRIELIMLTQMIIISSTFDRPSSFLPVPDIITRPNHCSPESCMHQDAGKRGGLTAEGRRHVRACLATWVQGS